MIILSLLDGRAIRDWCRDNFFMKENILDTEEDVSTNTTPGKLVDALVIKEIFQNVSDGKFNIYEWIVVTNDNWISDGELSWSSRNGSVSDKIHKGIISLAISVPVPIMTKIYVRPVNGPVCSVTLNGNVIFEFTKEDIDQGNYFNSLKEYELNLIAGVNNLVVVSDISSSCYLKFNLVNVAN